MATSPERAEQQRAQQASLVLAFMQPFLALWAGLSGRAFAQRADEVLQELQPLVRRHALAQIQSSVLWYEQLRDEDGLRDRYRVPLVDPPSPAEVERTFRALTADLYIPRDLPAEMDGYVDALLEKVTEDLGAEISDKIVDAGRAQTKAAVLSDPVVQRWARVAKPGACAFCMMLATRGAVYASEEAAGKVSAGGDARGSINRFHPDCRCELVGVTGRWELPEHVREALELYERVTADKKGSAKARAFRQAYEGRDVTGGPSRVKRAASEQDKTFASAGFDDPAWVAHQMALTESLPNSPWRTKQLERLRKAARRRAA